MMGAAFFSYVYTTVCMLRITESEKQQAKFGNKERPVLRQPKMHAKRKKKAENSLTRKITFPYMVKARIAEQQERGTRVKGK
jgi:hypothetical protein